MNGLKKIVEYVGGEPVVKLVKGDAPGHEFHGNQYSAALGGSPKASERTHAGLTAHAVESNLSAGKYRAALTKPPISGKKDDKHELVLLGQSQHNSPQEALAEAKSRAAKY